MCVCNEPGSEYDRDEGVAARASVEAAGVLPGGKTTS